MCEVKKAVSERQDCVAKKVAGNKGFRCTCEEEEEEGEEEEQEEEEEESTSRP